MPPDTLAWLDGLKDAGRKTLVHYGVIEPSQTESQAAQATLGQFLDQYVKGRTDIQASTATVLGHTKRNLIEFFGWTSLCGRSTRATRTSGG